MNKKDLSERDICTKFITPALAQARWDVQWQIREQVYFTKGRIIVRGKLITRGKAKFAVRVATLAEDQCGRRRPSGETLMVMQSAR